MTRILVIDDDFSVSIAIQILLRSRGYEVVLAQTGHAGAEAFAASRFDVVMVDLFMPEMDGFETISKLRQYLPTVPIVAMSGFRFCEPIAAVPDFLDVAAKLGATSCLRKPFGPRQLMAAIDVSLPETFSQGRAVEG
jgi:CheY-like chemotaxis protein